MTKLLIFAAVAASLPADGFAGGSGSDLVPVANCSESDCTFRIKTETVNGPAFTPPLPFTSEADPRDVMQQIASEPEAEAGFRWWRIGIDYGAVDILVGEPFRVLGEQVLLVEQRAGFETVQQAHSLYQVTNSGFHQIAKFEDGIGLPHSSELKLSQYGFQYFDMFADYGTDKGFKIDEQRAVISTYRWRNSNGKISAELVSEATRMVPY